MLAAAFLALVLQAAPEEAPPRHIDDPSPLTGFVPQGSYEQGVRGAVSPSQSLKGPLDGAWVLSDPAGAQLYRFQLVDPGFDGGLLEGVWADLRKPGADARGFLTSLWREGPRLQMQFTRAEGGSFAVTLEPRPDGAYAGELTAGAERTAVVLTRP